ncbi:MULTISPECIES: plasmid-related protein [Stutzerimonas stutzeri subgroup]|uniref:plasmid-related protein n=1 Tax=Stutzerimonas stutzeri subgroup TaxID=578833 RepID=UPI0009B62250|nr:MULTISPECIES: plasmid-related protein [Stutzerimonas stutzeri subgroup]MBZ5754905.1 DNA-binding protein [Pseudomonas sp. S5(2021)]MCQ2040372.1 DNA-binding protein [Stutzerimonas kunmingensis]
MNTEQLLLDKFQGSPLLSIEQVADILHRSKDGLRITLSGNSELAQKLRDSRLKIGRRVYFKTQGIARLIDEASA